jgi:hypothetical protein
MREITSLTSSINILRIAEVGSTSLSSAAQLADLHYVIADLRNEVTITTKYSQYNYQNHHYY